MNKYDYKFIIADDYDGFTVKGVVINGYGPSSVLAGQDKICFIGSYETLAKAQAAYPDAQVSNVLIAPQNTFDHLPDDEDY